MEKCDQNEKLVKRVIEELLYEGIDEVERLRRDNEFEEIKRKLRDEVDLSMSGLHILEKRKRSGKRKYKMRESCNLSDKVEMSEEIEKCSILRD